MRAGNTRDGGSVIDLGRGLGRRPTLSADPWLAMSEVPITAAADDQLKNRAR